MVFFIDFVRDDADNFLQMQGRHHSEGNKEPGVPHRQETPSASRLVTPIIYLFLGLRCLPRQITFLAISAAEISEVKCDTSPTLPLPSSWPLGSSVMGTPLY